MAAITPKLLSWQWAGYARAHGARKNLALHAITAPLFVTGLATVWFAPWLGARSCSRRSWRKRSATAAS